MPRTLVEERDVRSVTAVERAADVLDVVYSGSAGPLGVKEISEATRLSMSTVHRILAALVKKGLTSQDPETKKYTVGRKMLDYALRYLRDLELPSMALPHMRRLRDATAETVTLSVVDGWTRIYVAQVESPQEIRQTVELGRRFPLHLGGSGKAILAFLPERDQELYLAQPGLAPGVDRPIDIDRLRIDLAETRSRGYSRSSSERLSGAASVAAPIRNYRGEVVGCMSVSGPAWRFTEERVAEFGRLVVNAAAEISRDLGARV